MRPKYLKQKLMVESIRDRKNRCKALGRIPTDFLSVVRRLHQVAWEPGFYAHDSDP